MFNYADLLSATVIVVDADVAKLGEHNWLSDCQIIQKL